MINFSDLNNKQLEAVKYDKGPLLVLAGAGSCKTRVITYKISNLIDNGIDYKSILSMTFTNKAADEMKDRVKIILNDNTKNVFVSTFHKFCGKVLRQFIDKLGYNQNYTIYDILDQKKLISDIKKNNNFGKIKEKVCINIFSKFKNNNIDYEDALKESYTDLDKQIAKCYKLYLDQMYKLNAIDFDDMILFTVKLLKNHSDVKQYINNRFRYILVDESQDTNTIQFELIKLLSNNGEHLTVVGDDDQSIYRFRGADISNILNFENVFSNTRIIKLTQNYRSTNNILNFANSVISNNMNRMGKDLWSNKGDGDKPIWTEYPNPFEEADKVIFDIKKNNDIRNTAILYRKNSQSRYLEEACIKYIKDVLSFLRLCVNEYDQIALFRVLNIPRRGIGDTSVEKIVDYSKENNISIYEALKQSNNINITKKAKDGAESFVNIIEKIKDKTELEHMIDVILDDGGYKEYLIDEYGDVEAEDRLDNINELKNKCSLFKFIITNQNYYNDLNNYNDNLSGIELLSEFLNELALVSGTDNIEDATDKLTLMTIHATKGLEYDNIYIVGLNEGILPSQLSIDEEDDVEEERRLCYVAITRAKKVLRVSSTYNNMLNGQFVNLPTSRFIDEMNDAYVTKNRLKIKLNYDPFTDDIISYGKGKK